MSLQQPLPVPAPALRTLVCRVVSVAAVAILAGARLLDAHDFWIVPDAFAIADGSTVTTGGRSGVNFPGAPGGTPASIADARLIGAQGETRIGEIVQEGKALLLRQRPAAAGQYVVAVSLQPRMTRSTGAAFRRYLALEGAADEAARLEREGHPHADDSISYRSTKYATTIVEVGRGPRAFSRSAGYPLEIAPIADPSAARVGDTLRFRVTVGGRPTAGLRVHAGAAADSALRVRGATSSDPDLHLLTDADGIVRVPLTKGGLWNLRTAHAGPQTAASGTVGAWDVHWTTLVFSVAGGSTSSATSSNDSAAVAEVVRRYGAALASGDSTTALDLLAPDVVILESGDVETREEYRSHHLAGDIAFARAVKREGSPTSVTVEGNTAWAWSTSTTQGEYRGRAINSAGAELVVLTRGADGRWRIRAVHWSSRSRRAP